MEEGAHCGLPQRPCCHKTNKNVARHIRKVNKVQGCRSRKERKTKEKCKQRQIESRKEGRPVKSLRLSGRWGLFQIVRGTSAAEFPPFSPARSSPPNTHLSSHRPSPSSRPTWWCLHNPLEPLNANGAFYALPFLFVCLSAMFSTCLPATPQAPTSSSSVRLSHDVCSDYKYPIRARYL